MEYFKLMDFFDQGFQDILDKYTKCIDNNYSISIDLNYYVENKSLTKVGDNIFALNYKIEGEMSFYYKAPYRGKFILNPQALNINDFPFVINASKTTKSLKLGYIIDLKYEEPNLTPKERYEYQMKSSSSLNIADIIPENLRNEYLIIKKCKLCVEPQATFNKGDIILKCQCSLVNNNSIPIKSKKNGLIEFVNVCSIKGQPLDDAVINTIKNIKVCTIYSKQDIIDRINYNYKICHDEIHSYKFIEGLVYDISSFKIKLSIKENNPTLSFLFKNKTPIKKSDILILCGKKSQISFEIIKQPYQLIYENFYCADIVLLKEDLEQLSLIELECLKIYHNESNEVIIFENDHICYAKGIGHIDWYESSKDSFKRFVRTYLQALKEIGFKYKEINVYNDNNVYSDPCYVYLMKDLKNGYYKIGISKKPEYRERTLQSEKPFIEMLCAKKYPLRKIAKAIESALHFAFDNQRIRGEWFNLSEKDVSALIETLK